jgi:hypothetical protein
VKFARSLRVPDVVVVKTRQDTRKSEEIISKA